MRYLVRVAPVFNMKNTLLKNLQIISNMITATITSFSLCPVPTDCIKRDRPFMDVTRQHLFLTGHCPSAGHYFMSCQFKPSLASVSILWQTKSQTTEKKIRLNVLKRLTVLKLFNVYLYLLRSCLLGYITRRIKEEK